MSRPTAEEWSKAAEALDAWLSPVRMLCDGYLVTVVLERTGRNRLQIVVYVDGITRGAWCQAVDQPEKLDDIPRRFCFLHRRQKMKKKELALWEKLEGKRECRRRGWYDPIYFSSPLWNSSAALIRHLKKHNREIEILSLPRYDELLKAKKEARNA